MVHQGEEESDDENLLDIDAEESEEVEEGVEKPEKPISVEKLEENVKQKYLSMTVRILRFLQLLCEGHYTELQNNLREQYNTNGVRHPRTFDFVAYVSQMFTIYVKSYVN